MDVGMPGWWWWWW